jgi:translocator protein
MRSLPALAAFVAGVLAIGITIGVVFTPGAWYADLEKPPFTPPDALFPPAWTTLYVLVAVAGWRIWTRAPKSRAMKLWFAQMGLNFLWSPVFFGAHLMAPGLLIILALLAAILAFIRETWATQRLAAALFLPYAAWVAFACALNASLLVLNAGN